MIYSTYSKKSTREKKFQFISFRRLGIIFLIVTTCLLVLLKVSTWLNAQELFLLKEIKVEGTRFIGNQEVLKLVQTDSLVNLLDLDLHRISEPIRQHPLIEDVSVSRRLPSTLLIKVTERKPLAILNQSELVAIDVRGKLLPEFKLEMLTDYPVISNVPFDKDHQERNHEVREILNLLHYLKTNEFLLYSEISEISYSKKIGLYCYLNDRAVPVIFGKENNEAKIAHLVTVLKILKTEEKLTDVQYFDLRFQNQVIVKENTKS